jgi:mono/diheme cytochrome c family protein
VKKSNWLRTAGIGLAAMAAMSAQAADDKVTASGKERFNQYCAVCHGSSAKGDGPFAPLMTTKPTDLTMLAKNNNGEFPFGKVYETIDGRSMLTAHGTTDMPMWGQELKDKGLASETELRGRLVETVIYLQSIQAK